MPHAAALAVGDCLEHFARQMQRPVPPLLPGTEVAPCSVQTLHSVLQHEAPKRYGCVISGLSQLSSLPLPPGLAYPIHAACMHCA